MREALSSFRRNTQVLALPLTLERNIVIAHPAIQSKGPEKSFQSNLNLLDDVLDSKTSLYLLLRRGNSAIAITFVPYQAPKDERELYLRYRHEWVQLLGIEDIKISLICKEIGEITDARSWVERDEDQQKNESRECTDSCDGLHHHSANINDAGYKKNKCRLCDRRMKNKITDGALEALRKLENEGDVVQIVSTPRLFMIYSRKLTKTTAQSLNSDLVLSLDLQTSCLSPEQVPACLPTTHPTFTLYRHPNKLLYFIFHSPDSATVQQRMKHTMAIPGVVNVHTKDCGVRIDQKIEIHEPDELVFDEGDDKIGRFRSVYLRGGWQGTESQYEGLERDRRFYDAVQ